MSIDYPNNIDDVNIYSSLIRLLKMICGGIEYVNKSVFIIDTKTTEKL